MTDDNMIMKSELSCGQCTFQSTSRPCFTPSLRSWKCWHQ